MSQHWYDNEGSPRYTIIGANGKERDTTLRDARKLNLSPSTTTIIAGAAKPGLDNYLQKQLLDAAISVKGGDKTEEEWRAAVVRKSKEHSKNAAAKGTAIHDALESYYLGNKDFSGHDKKVKEICEHVVAFMLEKFGDLKWTPERSFTSKLGFGGKVDMSHVDELNPIILDFKTKDTDDIKKMIPYDEHGMQTASYAVGLDIPNARRYNLFISTQIPGLVNLTESPDFERDWGMFEALLKLWQLRNKYVPGE